MFLLDSTTFEPHLGIRVLKESLHTAFENQNYFGNKDFKPSIPPSNYKLSSAVSSGYDHGIVVVVDVVVVVLTTRVRSYTFSDAGCPPESSS
jgi:hypothetical protein